MLIDNKEATADVTVVLQPVTRNAAEPCSFRRFEPLVLHGAEAGERKVRDAAEAPDMIDV